MNQRGIIKALSVGIISVIIFEIIGYFIYTEINKELGRFVFENQQQKNDCAEYENIVEKNYCYYRKIAIDSSSWNFCDKIINDPELKSECYGAIQKIVGEPGILGEGYYNTTVRGYIEVKKEIKIEEFSYEIDIAYLVIAHFFDNKMENFMKKAGFVNANNEYALELGCLKNNKIIGGDENYMSENTMKKIVESSKGSPVLLELYFEKQQGGYGCSYCCPKPERVLFVEEHIY